jgi:hypothetical protein
VIDDDWIRESKEIQEIMKIPLGKALLEKEMARQMRQVGINADGGYEAISSSEDSEDGPGGEDDDDDNNKMDVGDEPEPKHHKVSALRLIVDDHLVSDN